MFDFNSTTVMPSMGFRWKNSAHSYKGLFIKDVVQIHDAMRNTLRSNITRRFNRVAKLNDTTE